MPGIEDGMGNNEYGILAKTVGRCTHHLTMAGAGRRSPLLNFRATPLRVIIPGVRSSYILGVRDPYSLVIAHGSKFTLYWLWLLCHLQGIH